MTLPAVIVVMGVSGSGKTTIASRLAERLGWELAEGDSFHSSANVAKMRSGTPLTDEDRGPWLDAIAAWMQAVRASGRRAVVTCSALKRAYRARLAAGHDDVRFVYLEADPEVVRTRMAERKGHYMPVTLLQSQFDTLEAPAPHENPITVSIGSAPEDIVERIVAALI